MKGNFHVQFLGEGVAATSPPYPTGEVAIPPCYPAGRLHAVASGGAVCARPDPLVRAVVAGWRVGRENACAQYRVMPEIEARAEPVVIEKRQNEANCPWC